MTKYFDQEPCKSCEDPGTKWETFKKEKKTKMKKIKIPKISKLKIKKELSEKLEKKYKEYRQKPDPERTCPHCGKPCWPNYWCDERMKYMRFNKGGT